MKRQIPKRASSGQAMTEYILVVAAFLGIIAIGSGPVPVFPLMINAMQVYYDSLLTVVYYPIP